MGHFKNIAPVEVTRCRTKEPILPMSSALDAGTGHMDAYLLLLPQAAARDQGGMAGVEACFPELCEEILAHEKYELMQGGSGVFQRAVDTSAMRVQSVVRWR